jgi:hypothetical protein
MFPSPEHAPHWETSQSTYIPSLIDNLHLLPVDEMYAVSLSDFSLHRVRQ